MAKYQKPDALTTRLVNPLIATLTKLGLSVRGSHVLVVRGRRTGKMQEVPVNPVEVNGVRYLVAPRGDTQWVRNLDQRAHLRRNIRLCVTPCSTINCMAMKKRANIVYLS
jgi:hypothetical protein